MTTPPAFAVLGAGVMGLCVATELAARGHSVTLSDPAGGPGPQGCSWWAGGMLAPWCEFENAEEPVLRHGTAAIGWWTRHLGAVQGGPGAAQAAPVAVPHDGTGAAQTAPSTVAYGETAATPTPSTDPHTGPEAAQTPAVTAPHTGTAAAQTPATALPHDGTRAAQTAPLTAPHTAPVTAHRPSTVSPDGTGATHTPSTAPHTAPATAPHTETAAPPSPTVPHNGTLVLTLTRDRRELDRFARRTHGFRAISGDEIAALEPDLGGRFDRALFFPDEAHLDPRAALTILRDRLAAKGVTVTAEPPPGATLIDCRGLAARDLLPDLRGVRGEMLVLRCPDIRLSRPIRLLHPRVPIYLVPRGDGVFMLGATMIESDRRGVVTARSVLELLSAAYALHPAFGEAEIIETGADARPAFPDNLPRIGRTADRLYANGLYRHGYLLAPACAMQLADHIETDHIKTGTQPEFWHEPHNQR